jgi:hypothetical protein
MDLSAFIRAKMIKLGWDVQQFADRMGLDYREAYLFLRWGVSRIPVGELLTNLEYVFDVSGVTKEQLLNPTLEDSYENQFEDKHYITGQYSPKQAVDWSEKYLIDSIKETISLISASIPTSITMVATLADGSTLNVSVGPEDDIMRGLRDAVDHSNLSNVLEEFEFRTRGGIKMGGPDIFEYNTIDLISFVPEK